jgi:glycosyltransferase involved in cell wall biosynthesis
VPPRDRAGIARAARKLLENSELAARLSSAGRQLVDAHFQPSAMAARYAAIYDR